MSQVYKSIIRPVIANTLKKKKKNKKKKKKKQQQQNKTKKKKKKRAEVELFTSIFFCYRSCLKCPKDTRAVPLVVFALHISISLHSDTNIQKNKI